MPSRNRIKAYAPDTYYHIYNRGVAKQPIFRDQQDYAVFLNLIKRYLSDKPVQDNKGREYPWLHEDMELLAFCLMPNHFHLLIYQHDEQAMTKLLRGVCTAYTMYFNKRHKRVGTLFQDIFKASNILNDAYLLHISRYIHMNPTNYVDWEYSSLGYYLQQKKAAWVRPARILDLFRPDEYLAFLKDYNDYQHSLQLIAHELADDPFSRVGPWKTWKRLAQ